jgi:hypothetical protein
MSAGISRCIKGRLIEPSLYRLDLSKTVWDRQKKGDKTIMKILRLMMIGVLLVVSSGCYPFFGPVERDRREHEEHHHGDHGDYEHEEHKDYR